MDWAFVWYAGGVFIVAGIYVLLALDIVPGLRQERLGPGLVVPPEIFDWQVDQASAAGQAARERGLIRELRIVSRAAGLLGRSRYYQQARLRHPESHEIVEVAPERRVRLAQIARPAA